MYQVIRFKPSGTRVEIYPMANTRTSHAVDIYGKGKRTPHLSEAFSTAQEATHYVRLLQIAELLNDHHMRYAAGFYGSLIGGRYFAARVLVECNVPRLQVSDDFPDDDGKRHWITVPDDKIKFHNFNGRNIPLPQLTEDAHASE